ncbi:MAG: 3-deoxy-D-manno-octulosonate 8-phosphate phosphatase (KDO 8-P phosphatase) [Limisphaerales bacterium]|nr:MAG: 3-deoxy-D-manno-octulosonate 8-phosphate phosphatase (KDO 8-P phosphatase) [Limisphaerales bacterium]KAG0508819.1 MAG: 3-deoxy-D-manno-octulosonate 8-phosphate phosphatase (KDO 8-P phosphatase) [Limisphaerales bacterium]TXT49721.1 MAG: 3-deoxy-D-manno-octulosonate 8-phosphate phosphatase (KDO 8-P phosphatase) [Limisphaerales bacterium]
MPDLRRKLSAAQLRSRLKRIKLLLCDVDGVLTDGAIFITSEGEFKRFHVHDGLGQRLAARAGLKVGWVSARPSAVTTRRAEELKTDFIVQTRDGKVPAVERILAETGLGWADACFVGDDVVDLGVLRRVGLAIAPADGRPEARALAHFLTKASGGNGCVREVVEMILKAQGRWATVVEQHAK